MVAKIKHVPASDSPLLEGCPQDGVSFLNTPRGKTLNKTKQQDIACSKKTTPVFHHPSKGGEVSTKFNKVLKINDILLQPNPILELPYNAKLKEKARALRQARNLSEVLFWKQVTKGGFHTIDFDRQRVIGNYIVDFYVKQLGLVIEIDGSSHSGKEKYDSFREDYLKSLKLKVYRITIGDILNNMATTMIELEEYIVKHYSK